MKYVNRKAVQCVKGTQEDLDRGSKKKENIDMSTVKNERTKGTKEKRKINYNSIKQK